MHVGSHLGFGLPFGLTFTITINSHEETFKKKNNNNLAMEISVHSVWSNKIVLALLEQTSTNYLCHDLERSA